MPHQEEPLEHVAQLIHPGTKTAKAGGSRLNIQCIAHEDRTPSLTIWHDVRGKLAFNCHAGCTHDQIVDRLPPAALDYARQTWGVEATVVQFPTTNHKPQPALEPQPNGEIHYPYVTEDGEIAYVVVRAPGKRIYQTHYQKGHLVKGRGDAELIPYRLPDVIAANQAGDTIYVVEGEKDADNLARLGLTATTNPGGAGNWTEELNGWFAGAHVIIIPDNDQPGHQHALDVSLKLDQIAETIKIVQLPGLPDKGDISDWIEAGGTRQQLEQLVAKAKQNDQHDEWDYQPRRLSTSHQEVPLEALPEIMAEAISHIANTRKVARSVPYTAYMALASGILGTRYSVQVNTTWQSPINLYMLAVARSGDGKSPGFGPANQLLADIDQARLESMKETRARAKQQIRETKAKIKDAESRSDYGGVMALEMDLADLEAIAEKEAHISFIDVTPEALVDYLESNGGQGITIDDEGTILQHALGLYSSKPNIQLLLRAWDALPYTSQRRTTKTRQHISRPIIAIASAVQPSVIAEASSKASINERGLLARFLISWPEPMAGKRMIGNEVSDDTPVTRLNQHIMDLWKHVESIPHEHAQTRKLTFSKDAFEVFRKWHDDIERELTATHIDAADLRIIAKVRGSVPRIAAIIHLLENTEEPQITANDARRACLLGDYHREAGRAIDAGIETIQNAKRIIEHILQTGSPEVNTQELRVELGFHKKGRTQALYDALNALVDHHWIRPSDGSDHFPDAGRSVGKVIPNISVNPAAERAEI